MFQTKKNNNLFQHLPLTEGLYKFKVSLFSEIRDQLFLIYKAKQILHIHILHIYSTYFQIKAPRVLPLP